MNDTVEYDDKELERHARIGAAAIRRVELQEVIEFEREVYGPAIAISEEKNACKFPDKCLMPGPHIPSECYTRDMLSEEWKMRNEHKTRR
jgi:hypothetical protein